jgi:uncharacterized membrane protein
MMTGNIQAITTQTGKLQNGVIIERGMRMGRSMGGFGFHPLLAFFGFLLFILFIIFVIRAIRFAHRSDGNYGFGYLRHMHEMHNHDKCACENRPDQNRENQSPWSHEKADAAMEILRKRYAAGEINKEEFEEKERILKS